MVEYCPSGRTEQQVTTRRIGRYEILEELGRGAMGAVYRARDPQIGRTVAIKVVRTTGLTDQEVEEYKQRFFREAQAAGQMSHPGIITIHDITEDEAGNPCLIMEYVEGTTLADLLTPPGTGMPAERLTLEQSLDIGVQMAHALDYAHRRGVVHRDIKPANILITSEGRSKIADFGIAKLEGTQLTTTGAVMGTPAFMSPEQFTGGKLDGRSDLFSLGAVLYWMCTGEKPFAGDTVSAVSFKIVYQPPVDPRKLNPSLPGPVDSVLMKCLAKDPAQRYPSAKELAADLEAARSGRHVSVAAPLADDVTAVGFPMPPAPSPTAKQPAAAEKPARPAPVEQRVISPGRRAPVPTLYLGIGAAVLLLILALVAFWPRGGDPEAQPPAQTQPAASVPEPQPAAPVGAAGSPPVTTPGAPKAANKTKRQAGVIPSTIALDVLHDFRTAKIEIYADGKFVTESPLRGQSRTSGGRETMRGTLRSRVELPTGTSSLSVVVTSPLYNYEESKVIPMRAGSGTLRVEASGSTSFHTLTVRWQ